jgi:hypothetical protein
MGSIPLLEQESFIRDGGDATEDELALAKFIFEKLLQQFAVITINEIKKSCSTFCPNDPESAERLVDLVVREMVLEDDKSLGLMKLGRLQ